MKTVAVSGETEAQKKKKIFKILGGYLTAYLPIDRAEVVLGNWNQMPVAMLILQINTLFQLKQFAQSKHVPKPQAASPPKKK